MNSFPLNTQATQKTFDTKTLALLIASIVIMFFLRGIWTIPIEVAGDAVRKFYAAAEIVRTGDWTILLQNHHTMRWSIIVPQTFINQVFGIRYEVYYILPLLTFALYFVIVLYALKDHLNTSQKLLLGALLFADPMSFRNSSQLMTAGPAIFYAISACYLLATYSRNNPVAVVFSAILFFCAYGAQGTYVSFAAGGFLWLALIQRSWRLSTVFAGSLLTLFIVECLFFNYLSGWDLTFGRVEALISGSHVKILTGESGQGQYVVGFLRLFTRWLHLPVLDVFLSAVFFIGGLVFIGSRNKHKLPAFISCSYLVGLCFALFVSFAVRGIDPITPIQGLLARYLSPFLPFAIITSVYFLKIITEENRKTWDTRMEMLAALLVFTIFATPQTFDHPHNPMVKIRPEFYIWKAEKEYLEFATQISEGSLLYRGRKKFVVEMLTAFKFPLFNGEMKTEPSTITLPTEVKCVREFRDIPSKLNVRECNLRDLKLLNMPIKN